MTPIEQLKLDFARLVAGRHDGVLIDDDLPDYPNDWNATIEAIEARGWRWAAENYRDLRNAEIVFGPGWVEHSALQTEPPCTALMRAAVEAARSEEK